MIDIAPLVPPGFQLQFINDTAKGQRLGIETVQQWEAELCPGEQLPMCSARSGQSESFTAAADYKLQLAVDFYQQQLGDARWQMRRNSSAGFDSVLWRWEKQMLLMCWTKEPVEWKRVSGVTNNRSPALEKVRLVWVYATPRPA